MQVMKGTTFHRRDVSASIERIEIHSTMHLFSNSTMHWFRNSKSSKLAPLETVEL